MGNVIPWSQIHPSITSQEPFVAVVIIDSRRQICVSEMVPFEQEALASADTAAPALVAAAQAAAARVASGYRARRKQSSTGREKPGAHTLTLPLDLGSENPATFGPGLRVLKGGKA